MKVRQTMEEDNGYQSFVKIGRNDVEDFMELPREKDATLLLSTVQAQFPSAIGLKYKSSSGGWRGIRAENNVLDPPHGGWGEGIYIITESDALKRKVEEESPAHSSRKSKKAAKLLDDFIVLGLPYTTTEEELNAYFTDACGELALCELKLDRDTKKSRGFGFIRFKTEEGAEAALRDHHEIGGRKLNIRMSKQHEEIPMKLFIGRLAPGTTQQDFTEYFSDFGEVVDIFVPNPFRGFGFVTFADQEDAQNVLRTTHNLRGARLNISAAEERTEDKRAAGRSNFSNSNTSSYDGRGNTQYGQHPVYSSGNVHHQQPPPPRNDTVSELKNMLLTLINDQK